MTLTWLDLYWHPILRCENFGCIKTFQIYLFKFPLYAVKLKCCLLHKLLPSLIPFLSIACYIGKLEGRHAQFQHNNNLDTYIKWYVVRCGFENGQGLGPCVWNTLNIRSPIWPLNEHMNLCHNEEDIHVSSKNYGANGYMHNLDLLTIISQWLCVSYPTKSECKENNIQITASTSLQQLCCAILFLKM